MIYLPVKLDQWKVHAQLLMELGELAVRAKQMGWIQLSVACYLQNVHIILLHAVVLLEAHYFNNLQPAILLHAVDVV